jgi:HEPN domain-containing protein
LHAHLTAEKALKALLIFRDILVPRVHDLFDLLSRLADKDKFKIDENDLEILNSWSIRGRYPADLPDATHKMVEYALIAAQNIFDAVKSTITDHAHDPLKC